MKYVYISPEATTDGKEYGGFAEDDVADALAANEGVYVVGDPGTD